MFINLDKVEILDGLMVFNPWVMLLNIILFTHFLYSWYKDYKTTGWKINLWHYTLLLNIGIPFFLIYPFCSSAMNVFATGTAYDEISKYVDLAYIITIIGYACIIVGSKFAKIDTDKASKYDFFAKILYTNITTGFALRILSIFSVVFLCIAAFLSFSAGLPFNGRAWFLTNPTYRSIGNLFTSAYGFTFLYFGLRVLNHEKRNRKEIFILIMMIISGLFWGSRGLFFGSILSVALYWFYLNKSISLKKIILGGLLIIVGVMAMSVLRSGGTLDGEFLTEGLLLNIFYGNSFSDCRDFAWMLSGFSEDMYRLGATYIGGLTSFLPSAVFTWRHDYSIGVWSLELAGIANPTGEHPGLRGGMFFELYLNFSIIGVILYGLMYGYLLKKADLWNRFFIDKKKDPINAYVYQYPIMVFSWFSITAGMFGAYVFLGLHAVCLLLNTIPIVLNNARELAYKGSK